MNIVNDIPDNGMQHMMKEMKGTVHSNFPKIHKCTDLRKKEREDVSVLSLGKDILDRSIIQGLLKTTRAGRGEDRVE